MTTTDKVIGGFLIGEASLSIVLSEDRRKLSQFGRLLRMGIGYYIWKDRR